MIMIIFLNIYTAILLTHTSSNEACLSKCCFFLLLGGATGVSSSTNFTVSTDDCFATTEIQTKSTTKRNDT